ncbi:pyridoxal kinase [Chitinophaga sp. Cy-1792]|uniref:pyridoxal kinase n=1 Tax=Chitinophaga sp. Cy-1792 TaxID=2608339 RepID=UPI00141D8179|nr:pyridoxal kinase [Chitinophaga sp. Cy-1792]NIG55197.1 pyridoxal kinase [Chitinophaga sp. Cy-1792]
MPANNILTIQSLVSTGYVGNNAAMLAIQLHGFDPVMLPTVLLSAHTGHKAFYGESISPELFEKLLRGIKEIDILADTDYLLTGYIATESLVALSAAFIAALKQEDTRFVFLYDPVFGDMRTDGLYVPAAVADLSVSALLPLSDVVTPNHFELEYILQREVRTIEALQEAVAAHPLLSTRAVVMTSAEMQDAPTDQVEVILLKDNTVKRFRSKKVEADIVGTGDLFAATIAAQLNMGRELETAISITMDLISSAMDYVKDSRFSEINAKSLLKFRHLLEA